MPGAVITSCTNRKRSLTSQQIRARHLRPAKIDDLADAWLKMVSTGREHGRPAGSLYVGRSFSEARLTSEALNANLYVLSAGLGLLDVKTVVPSYGATISPSSEDTITERIIGEPNSPTAWWQQLYQKSPFTLTWGEFIDSNPSSYIIVALPKPYLQMIGQDLLSLPHSHRDRLRIFSKGAGQILEKPLQKYVMPYDDRLDSKESAYRGTQADFAQRAAHHFVRLINRTIVNDASADAEKVENALAKFIAPKRIVGSRASDAEILKIIEEQWTKASGRSSRLLRILRDDLLIACEQKRFQTLFRKIKMQRELEL